MRHGERTGLSRCCGRAAGRAAEVGVRARGRAAGGDGQGREKSQAFASRARRPPPTSSREREPSAARRSVTGGPQRAAAPSSPRGKNGWRGGCVKRVAPPGGEHITAVRPSEGPVRGACRSETGAEVTAGPVEGAGHAGQSRVAQPASRLLLLHAQPRNSDAVQAQIQSACRSGRGAPLRSGLEGASGQLNAAGTSPAPPPPAGTAANGPLLLPRDGGPRKAHRPGERLDYARGD